MKNTAKGVAWLAELVIFALVAVVVIVAGVEGSQDDDGDGTTDTGLTALSTSCEAADVALVADRVTGATTSLSGATGDYVCCPGAAGSTIGVISGGGLNTTVPEPLRSQMIAAARAYDVPPSVVAAVYLTEQNGFSLEYKYYDSGRSDAAFVLTPGSSEWHLEVYGTAGIWPAGGTFRGPFQFGPIWESSYQTPEHPNVLAFADAAYGAAHYMADLGAAHNPSEDQVRAAAASYNGQTSFTIGGGIRNPDPGEFTVVRELYADQVVRIAAALSTNTGATAALASMDPAGGSEPSSSSTQTAIAAAAAMCGPSTAVRPVSPAR